ncbi:hypothetical protein QPX33_06975, partial [Corynebacterium propinquum]|nr:hypothetical protein [Corynebacterium propinquum]
MTDAEDSELAGNSNRDSVPVRPQRGMDDSPDAKGNASPEDRRKPQSDADTRGDSSEWGDNPFLLAQISAHLQENHLHLPIVAPDQEQLANIKENSPELYEIYLDSIRKAVDADYIQRTYPYTEPGLNDKKCVFTACRQFPRSGLSGYRLNVCIQHRYPG